jgi:CheY-like chemotaxis protein
MGGTLSVQSTLGQGSAFILELAASEDPLARYEAIAGTNLTSRLGVADGGTVLYIEDNPANLRLMERIIGQRGDMRLFTATTGRGGLEVARRARPDVVLLDLHLPDMDGAEVLRHLKADPATAEVSVVMVSADATAEQIERLLEGGAEDYLTKPFDLARLFELLDTRLEKATQRP